MNGGRSDFKSDILGYARMVFNTNVLTNDNLRDLSPVGPKALVPRGMRCCPNGQAVGIVQGLIGVPSCSQPDMLNGAVGSVTI